MMEDKRARRGEPVFVDGREGTIEFGDDTGMSIYCETGGRVIINNADEVWRRVMPAPDGLRPVWDHVARHDRKFTLIRDPALLAAINQLQAACAAAGAEIVGDFSVWVGGVGYHSIEVLSGDTLTLWKSSRGQITEAGR